MVQSEGACNACMQGNGKLGEQPLMVEAGKKGVGPATLTPHRR